MTTYLLQEFLAELVVSRHEKRDSQLMELNEMPLYPTEVRPRAQFIVPGIRQFLWFLSVIRIR
jgi:hypothetical protein